MKSRNATSTDRVLQSCCWALLSSLITLVAKLCTSWTTEEKRSLSNHVVLYIVCSQVRRELLTMEPNGSVSPPKDRPRPRWSRCSSSGLRYGSFVNSLSSLAAAEEVVHKSPISPRRSYVAVAVLCYVNLINYMERYTIAGWVISCAHMTTLPVKATAFGWPTRCFAVTQACSSTFRSSLISVTAWLHFCKQVWWCTHTPAAQFPLFVKMTLCNACCKWISQRSWHRRKCGITHSHARVCGTMKVGITLSVVGGFFLSSYSHSCPCSLHLQFLTSGPPLRLPWGPLQPEVHHDRWSEHLARDCSQQLFCQ